MSHVQGDAFSGEVVDDDQNAIGASVGESVVHIHAPDVVSSESDHGDLPLHVASAPAALFWP